MSAITTHAMMGLGRSGSPPTGWMFWTLVGGMVILTILLLFVLGMLVVDIFKYNDYNDEN